MCLNRQVDSIRITLHRRNLHRIENGLVRFSVNRVLISTADNPNKDTPSSDIDGDHNLINCNLLIVWHTYNRCKLTRVIN